MLMEIIDTQEMATASRQIVKPLSFGQFRSRVRKIKLAPEACVYTGTGTYPVLDIMYTKGIDIGYRNWKYPHTIELEYGPPFVPGLKAILFSAFKKIVLEMQVPKSVDFFAGESRIPILEVYGLEDASKLIIELGTN